MVLVAASMRQLRLAQIHGKNTLQSLADKGIVGEDAANLIKEDGTVDFDTLGKIQPDTRNPVIATALEVMGVTENRYSGIPTIRREFKEYELPEPEFVNQRGEFTVIFRLQDSIQTAKEDDKTAQLLNYCKTPRTRQELAKFLGLSSVTYAIKTYIQPLIDSGVIGLTEKKRSSPNQKYYTK